MAQQRRELLIARYLQKAGYSITFLEWMLVAVPLMAGLLVFTWLLLWRSFPSGSTAPLILDSAPLSRRGTFVMTIFGITVLLWLTGGLHGVPPAVVALLPIVASEHGWDADAVARPHGHRTTVVVHLDVESQIGSLHLGPALREAEPHAARSGSGGETSVHVVPLSVERKSTRLASVLPFNSASAYSTTRVALRPLLFVAVTS